MHTGINTNLGMIKAGLLLFWFDWIAIYKTKPMPGNQSTLSPLSAPLGYLSAPLGIPLRIHLIPLNNTNNVTQHQTGQATHRVKMGLILP